MAGPIEILIVAGVFGVIGAYLYVVSRFIRESEKTPETPSAQTRTSDSGSNAGFGEQAHAH